MMSSFSENIVAAAPESQESLAHTPMQSGYVNDGVADNGASAVYAPVSEPASESIFPSNLSEAAPATTEYQQEGVLLNNQANLNVVMNDDNGASAVYAPVLEPASEPILPSNLSETAPATTECQQEGVLLNNQASLNVVMNDQNMDNGASAVYAPVPESASEPTLVYQSEAVVSDTVEVVSEVMNSTVVASELAVEVAVADVVANDGNDGHSISNNKEEEVTKVLPTFQTSPPVVTNDQNNNVFSSEIVTPRVVGNENISTEVVTPGVVSNLNSNGSNQVVFPSVVGNQDNCGSNQVVTPSVVHNENNGISNNVVATNSGVGEAIRRKRGRPRKYPNSEASTVLVSSPSMAMQSGGPQLANALVQGSSEKRRRGRPAGSGKKHKADAPFTFGVSPAISGSTAAGFTPYIITVRSGEYVMPKLLSLSQVDKQVVCVLSASGTISHVTLQQPSSSGGTVTYQGHFEILSLSGSFLLSESGGRRSRTGGLSVSLAVPNGCIFGGGVAGPLIADSDVQIIVGTFQASEQDLTRQGCNELLTTPLNHMSSVGRSPPFRALSSESTGVPVRPFNHSNRGCNQQPFSNAGWM